MAKEKVGTGDGAEQLNEFQEKWSEWDDGERWKWAAEMRSNQAGLDRSITKHRQEIEQLKVQLDETTGRVTDTQAAAVNTVEGIQNEIATIRAERELVKRQTRMIEKAIEGNLDPALAVRFAETTDADSTFELAVAEIERKVEAGIQQKLVAAAHHPTAGDDKPTNLTYQDIMHMSEAEQRRLPQEIFDRALREAAE